MAEEKLTFQAEVSRLLNIVANSLYSNKEIFVRELISNASDACDRLRYLALTEPGLVAQDPDYQIVIEIERRPRQLKISDNGIGMNHDELIANLGNDRALGHLGLCRTARRSGREPELDRPVRRRLLFGLHGCRQGRGDEPQGRRRPGVALGVRWKGRVCGRRMR